MAKTPTSVTPEPRLTNAQMPPRRREPLTLSNLIHHRYYSAVRELALAVLLAAASLVVAYFWVGAADPSLP